MSLWNDDLTAEEIRAIHWCYDNLTGFTSVNYDDFVCAVEQKEAELLGMDGGKA